jgi:hypothetical protein
MPGERATRNLVQGEQDRPTVGPGEIAAEAVVEQAEAGIELAASVKLDGVPWAS